MSIWKLTEKPMFFLPAYIFLYSHNHWANYCPTECQEYKKEKKSVIWELKMTSSLSFFFNWFNFYFWK